MSMHKEEKIISQHFDSYEYHNQEKVRYIMHIDENGKRI